MVAKIFFVMIFITVFISIQSLFREQNIILINISTRRLIFI